MKNIKKVASEEKYLIDLMNQALEAAREVDKEDEFYQEFSEGKEAGLTNKVAVQKAIDKLKLVLAPVYTNYPESDIQKPVELQKAASLKKKIIQKRLLRVAYLLTKIAEQDNQPIVLTEDDFDALEKLDPKVQKQWKGYWYKMTYEIISEESAAEGDVESRGWEEEKSSTFPYLDSLLQDRTVQNINWVEWSSSQPNPMHDCIVSDSEQNPRTGDYKNYYLWIVRGDKKPLSKSEMSYINKKLHIR